MIIGDLIKKWLGLEWVGYVLVFILGFITGVVLGQPEINVYARQMLELLSQ